CCGFIADRDHPATLHSVRVGQTQRAAVGQPAVVQRASVGLSPRRRVKLLYLSGRIVAFGTTEWQRPQNLPIQAAAYPGTRTGAGDRAAALPDALQCGPKTAQDVVGAWARGCRHLLLPAEGRTARPQSRLSRVC